MKPVAEEEAGQIMDELRELQAETFEVVDVLDEETHLLLSLSTSTSSTTSCSSTCSSCS